MKETKMTMRTLLFVLVGTGTAPVGVLGCDDPNADGADSDIAEESDLVDVVAEADVAEEEGGEYSTHAFISASFGYTLPSVMGPFCRCEPPLPSTSETVGEEGGCALVRRTGARQDWSHCTPLDVGDVYVSFDSTDYLLAPMEGGPSMPCFRDASATVPEPAAGVPVRFHSTGGADLPAFDYTMTMPATIELEGPAADATLTVGDPWSASWTPTVTDEVLVRFDGDDLNLYCRTTAASPFVVPAALTALWTETDIVGGVAVATQVEQEHAGAITLRLSLARSGGFVPVTYAAGD
jgi:hypothetical protein